MSEEEIIDLSQLELTTDGKVIAKQITDDQVDVANQQEKKNIRYSVSLIKDYQACPAKAYARITKQKSKKSYALINGIAIHESIEMFIKERADMKETYAKSFIREGLRNEVATDSIDAVKINKEAQPILVATHEILQADNFVDKIDPLLCEVGFKFERNGRLFVGKIDLMFYNPDGDYSIIDAKSSKNVPNQLSLNKDLQFTTYHAGALLDPTLPTYGKWAKQAVWWHLRGKNIAKDANGNAVRKNKTSDNRKFQYFFPTSRTQAEVEEHFDYTIEPIARQMEKGQWYRNEGEACGWCSYFDASKQRCSAEIPKPKND